MSITGQKTNWQKLAFDSHYQTAVAIADELAAGNIDDASQGLEELIEAMGRSERRALRSQLIRLMVHVLKWNSQPQKRTRGWALSILQVRREIEDIQEEVPSLNRAANEALWEKCTALAIREAELEMGCPVSQRSIRWEEAFETEYVTFECGANDLN